ncbi:hypothetical protein AB1Y20_003722 [Prymnesium parvum]|uniref:Uncharacterized protein n=1 Tax=Prymnesium parvum TaxID=97485 RepID=A0AB34J4N7_PRYPA|mmetsp:Transcript_44555/g.110922  ORF Transcript_44555/g.110922 Transcript_44555/m.110922 type:complete len:587 (-) Transcript_44555:216-1976(-)
MPCARANECLAALAEGSFLSGGRRWQWNAPTCCGFGHVGSHRARELLRGRHLAFIGDSQTRRHMWSLVDAVAGAKAVRRTRGHAVVDSNVAFDERAVRVNDTIFDSQRAYHAGQVVLLNVETGRWVLLDPSQLCGIPKREWTADRWMVEPLRRGHEPRWTRMRGSRYRVSFDMVASNRHAAAREPQVHARAAVRELALFLLRDWGCQEKNAQDCTFHSGMQRQCAQLIRAEARYRSDKHTLALRVLMGNTGDCMAAAMLLSKRLTKMLPPAETSLDELNAMNKTSSIEPRVQALHLGSQSEVQRLSPPSHAFFSSYGRVGAVLVDAFCETQCRRSYHLYCQPPMPADAAVAIAKGAAHTSRTFEAALRGAIVRHARELQLPGGYGVSGSLVASPLAVFSFIYGASVEPEWSELLLKWATPSFGFGADVIILGTCWSAVTNTRVSAKTGVMRLKWTHEDALVWTRVLNACTKAAATREGGRCVLRMILSLHLRIPRREPYDDFRRNVRPIAQSAGVALLDAFDAFWEGAHQGLLRHHDSTRIHYSDSGRFLLAQVTLNALPHIFRTQLQSAILPPLLYNNSIVFSTG